MLKKFYLTLLIVCSISFLSFQSFAAPTMHPTPTQSSDTEANLKKAMSQFGSLVAGLQILMVKEKKPDYETIGITLKEMKEALSTLQKSDTENAYKPFTDKLALSLDDVIKKNEKKDKKIYQSIDKMTDTCFRCHAVHRDQDFLTR